MTRTLGGLRARCAALLGGRAAPIKRIEFAEKREVAPEIAAIAGDTASEMCAGALEQRRIISTAAEYLLAQRVRNIIR